MTIDEHIDRLRGRLAKMPGSRRSKASRLGIPEPTLRQFESGRTTVRVATVAQIERALAAVDREAA